VVLELAEKTGLSELIDKHMICRRPGLNSAWSTRAGKLTWVIAAMMCGAYRIDDVNVLRAGCGRDQGHPVDGRDCSRR
jgi:hypothetical protein